MKIAHIVSTYPPYFGGMGNAARAMAETLNAQSIDTTVLTMRAPLGMVIEDTVSVRRFRPIPRIGNAGLLPQLFWHLDDFDLVHLHYPFFGGAEVVALWHASRRHSRERKPLVLHYQMDAIAGGRKGKIFSWHNRFILPRILAASDRIIVSSDDYADHSILAQHPDLVSGKRIAIPNGVDTERFRPRPRDSAFMARHHLAPTDRFLLFVGGLDEAHRFKGLDVLLRAFSFFSEMRAKGTTGDTVKLVIVGDGALRVAYEALAVELHIADRVVFAGRVRDDELPTYYNLADFFVLPSVSASEAFGMVLIEAMASGVPVIASHLAGVRTVLEEGITGFLTKPGDVIGLAKILDRAFQDPKRRRAMGKAGRTRVETLYSWDSIGRQLEDCYRALLPSL